MSESEPTGDIDPDMAAAAMQSEASEVPIENGDAEDAAVEIGPTAPEADISIKDRLLSTEPNNPLESDELNDPWNPEEGGAKRIYRGVMKIGDIEGLPASADLVIGGIELFVTQSDNDSDNDRETEEQRDQPEAEPEPEPQPPEPESNGEGVAMSEVNP